MDIGSLHIDTHPMKTRETNVGEAEIPVTFGGVSFTPGEWLYADEDGVIVSSSPHYTKQVLYKTYIFRKFSISHRGIYFHI
jgi:regulator of RNase E activity RraA